MKKVSEMSQQELLDHLSFLERDIKSQTDRKKEVVERLKDEIDANGGQPLRGQFCEVALVHHSFALVETDSTINAAKAKDALVKRLMQNENDREYLSIDLDTKKIAEELQRENLVLERAMDTVGLKLEPRYRFTFRRL